MAITFASTGLNQLLDSGISGGGTVPQMWHYKSTSDNAASITGTAYFAGQARGALLVRGTLPTAGLNVGDIMLVVSSTSVPFWSYVSASTANSLSAVSSTFAYDGSITAL